MGCFHKPYKYGAPPGLTCNPQTVSIYPLLEWDAILNIINIGNLGAEVEMQQLQHVQQLEYQQQQLLQHVQQLLQVIPAQLAQLQGTHARQSSARGGETYVAGLDLAGDFDLWARFWRHAALHAVNVPLACFRLQSEQKTARQRAAYMREAEQVLRREKMRPPSGAEILLRRALRQLAPALQRRLPEGTAYTARFIESGELGGGAPSWRVTQERFV